VNTAEKLERIAEILPQVINTKIPVRVGRGRVHAVICRLLRIPRSNANLKLIKAVLAATGIRAVTIRSRMFYVSYPDANPANRAKVRAIASDKKV
jgi:hypothetical protein